MNSQGTAPIGMTIAIYLAIGALLIWRYSRPMRMTITRMWFGPLILTGLTALSIWGSQQVAPAPTLSIVLAVFVGAALGAPLGVLRGMHTNVRATDRPGVMYLDPSWIVIVLWLGAFVIRALLRNLLPHGTIATTVGDGLIVFAISAVVVSYYVIYRKYVSLEVQAGQV